MTFGEMRFRRNVDRGNEIRGNVTQGNEISELYNFGEMRVRGNEIREKVTWKMRFVETRLGEMRFRGKLDRGNTIRGM
jgi:hypothetical protein